MRAVGVRGGAWLGGVNAWGDVFVDGKERLRWFVAADDRWYRPSRETTVRQREVSGVPVIETLINVPGCDASQRVYGVADVGGALDADEFSDVSFQGGGGVVWEIDDGRYKFVKSQFLFSGFCCS